MNGQLIGVDGKPMTSQHGVKAEPRPKKDLRPLRFVRDLFGDRPNPVVYFNVALFFS
ncbi:hypothetical protein V7x_54260 [Crateriforma conspicua]|uniref:Uncharacterized protein n=1 Tax=Crateriforma conspicua TaxID=2527996 RepID=A0A5C6FLW4_9PLAN|nr:hypothetical protein V7x_54260 [Crateriforma conspicua]